MTLAELAASCRDEAQGCCDEQLRVLLLAVATVLDSARYGGTCTLCHERKAEVNGHCRPCYQRRRRHRLAVVVVRD